MNILFITHDVGLYGASRSLGLSIKSLLEYTNLKKDNIYLAYNIVNFKLLRIFSGCSKGSKSILNNYLRSLKHIYKGAFPFSLSYLGRPETLRHRIGSFVLLLIFPVYWFICGKRILKKNSISHIHLNSLVLWPVLLFIPKEIRKIIHIRERHDKKISGIFSDFKINTIKKYADVIIAIDKVTAKPFKDSSKLKIIRNPFDMRIARNKRGEKKKILDKYRISGERSNIALIGSLSENKGQEFFLKIADSFQNSDLFNFLIVGKVNNFLSEILKRKVSKIRNTYYIGEVEDIGDIYAISEIIIRCEEYYITGRTSWEAFFAGSSNILLPVKNSSKIKECVPEDEILEQFIFYTARDINDARSKLISTKSRKVQSIDIDNNLKEFSSKFFNVFNT